MTKHSFAPLAFLNVPWLQSLLQPLTPYFREALAISLFTNLLALAVPVFTLQVYDRVVAHHGLSTLVGLVIGVLLALGFDFILRQSRSRLLQNVALHLDARLGRQLYAKLVSLPLRTLEDRPSAFWQAIFADMATLRSVLSGPSAVMLLDIPFALLFLVVIFLLAPAVAWLLLLIIPAFLALTWFSSRQQNHLADKESGRQASRETLIAELVAGRTTVKALRIDKALQNEFEALHAETIQKSYVRGARADGFIALGQVLSQFATVLLVSVGAMAIIQQDLTTGSLIATTMLTSRIIQPLNTLLSTWKQFALARHAVLRLTAFFAFPSERENPTLARPRPAGELTVEGASFAYAENASPAVQDINLRIAPGHVVGIVGRNGCGKTTLVKLLLGLYQPDKGRILLDGADMRQFSRDELAEWIGYVPQDGYLFAGSIKDNIRKNMPDATDDRVLAAARLSGADAFVVNLPDGYDTEIGEAGHILSGGQRQRIAIARALLRNPPVLLLDEVSNHLDTEAESALCETLRKLREQRTILVVTHSPLLLQACDKMVVMDKGRIVMAGAGAEVLAKISGAPQHP